MLHLPLFYYPTTWVIVDDDKIFLKCMELVLKKHNFVKTFQSPNEALDFIKDHRAQDINENILKSITEDRNYGSTQHIPVNFDITELVNLTSNINRYDELSGLVIDYHMPEMNGFEFANASQNILVNKIMLTGTVDDEAVITGFNNNLIQKFIKKVLLIWRKN